MNKIILCVVLVLLLTIVGCGGGSSGGGGVTSGDIIGQVIDSNNNQPVAGVILLAGGKQSLPSDITGHFAINGISLGSQLLTGAGGTSFHYVITPTTVTVNSGSNNAGSIAAYKIQGAGVIVESPNRVGVLSYGNGLITGKNQIGKGFDLLQRVSYFSGNFHTFASSSSIITGNITYFYLKWDPVKYVGTNLTHYIIKYLGTDGNKNIQVWDSNNITDTDDPIFDSSNPKAYLDLGFELKDQGITTAGNYRFQIVGIDGNGSEVVQLPWFEVSLGTFMNNCPQGFSSSPSQLSWNSVTGAYGYRVLISTDQRFQTIVWDSGTSPLLPSSTTTVTLPVGLVVGSYYYCCIAAYSSDFSGYTAEVMMKVTGFTKQ